MFKVINILDDIVYLKGAHVRLCADSHLSDLVKAENDQDDFTLNEELKESRDEYFYLPGKILHIDGDRDYLDRCMFFYNSLGIKANGISISENNIHLLPPKSVFHLHFIP